MPREDPPQRELTPVPPLFEGWDPIAAILCVTFWIGIAAGAIWSFAPLFHSDPDYLNAAVLAERSAARSAEFWGRAMVSAVGAWMLLVAFLIARLKPRPEPHSITGGKPPDPT